jgi:sulfatase maturation enzyme AslB (radical SAM superfamily)
MASPRDVATLDVVLTAGCNLRCSYCYQNDKKARSIDWETLRASVDLLLASDRPEVTLLFIGGEPLLEFGLLRRAVEHVEAHRRRDQRVRYQIVTNGTLLTGEHLRLFAGHSFEVQISFDGVEAAQALRGRGTFRILDGLLDRLRAGWPRLFDTGLSVNITLVVDTLAHLADSVEYFIGKQLREIAISPAVTHQGAWHDGMMDELERQFARIFRTSVQHYDRTGSVPLVLFRRHRETSPHAPAGLSLCGAGRGETLAVDVDGEVHGCLMFADSYQVFPTAFLRNRFEAMRMGSVTAPDLPERMAAYPAAARAAGIFHERQRKYSSYRRCAECEFMTSCAVCPVSIGHRPGNADPHRIPDFLCAYNLVSLAYRARFPAQPDVVDILRGGAKVPRLMEELGGFAGVG